MRCSAVAVEPGLGAKGVEATADGWGRGRPTRHGGPGGRSLYTVVLSRIRRVRGPKPPPTVTRCRCPCTGPTHCERPGSCAWPLGTPSQAAACTVLPALETEESTLFPRTFASWPRDRHPCTKPGRGAASRSTSGDSGERRPSGVDGVAEGLRPVRHPYDREAREVGARHRVGRTTGFMM